MLFALIISALGGLSWSADAPATLRGRLMAQKANAELEGYVVWLEEGPKLAPLQAQSRLAAMAQIDKKFSPPFLALRRGDRVSFENLDSVFHNVFTLDKGDAFDLGLFKGKKHFAADLKTPIEGESGTTRAFDKAGKLHVFCNIHPDMVGTIFVFDHGYFAQSDKNGLFALPSPGPGRYTVVVDGPRLDGPTRIPLEVVPETPLIEVKLKLARVSVTPAHKRKDGNDYPSDETPY